MAQVKGIFRLTLSVPTIDSIGLFYRDIVGIPVLTHSDARWDFQCRASGHCDFSLVSQPGKAGIASIAFRVEYEKDLSNLVSAAAEAGATVLSEPSPSGDFPGELVAKVLDSDGNCIELVHRESYFSQGVAKTPSFGPECIGHVVLWTPQIDAMERLYGGLGLHVTDRTAMGMSFLRCNADHHSFALVRSKGKVGLQHVAFDVGSIDTVMREKGRLSALGIECIWGVGRHGPGNNIFAYYTDPAGHVFEFYCDMEKVPGDTVAEPIFWGPEHKGDIWGVAGAAPACFRP